jgi:hypothetical protein
MDGADSDRGLVIVTAGAGAGKTHRIKTQLSDWVKRKIVRPERILAVTFWRTGWSPRPWPWSARMSLPSMVWACVC